MSKFLVTAVDIVLISFVVITTVIICSAPAKTFILQLVYKGF